MVLTVTLCAASAFTFVNTQSSAASGTAFFSNAFKIPNYFGLTDATMKILNKNRVWVSCNNEKIFISHDISGKIQDVLYRDPNIIYIATFGTNSYKEPPRLSQFEKRRIKDSC